jgi:hypothetical protein
MKSQIKKHITPILIFAFAMCGTLRGQETLPPLENGKAPQTFEVAWAGFDPRAEPLDIEVIKEWEQDGIVLRIVRYRIGIFKGQKAMMAAVYGFPKGAAKLPGLVQIHGGGQYADANAVNYELAYRMQMQVPETLDLSKEDARTKELYGIGNDATDAFGRKCLLARKLVEKGVRFVQLYNGSWDSHDYIERAHGNLVRGVDQPIAALITDLKQRGLLESTLIVWCGEFGRTPDNGVRGGTAYGRDHNPNAMTMWLAGGGCNAGHTIGATDDLGMTAVEGKAHVRDFHVTLLRLLGLDDNKLTYYHGGRFKQLSQFGGTVIKDLIA